MAEDRAFRSTASRVLQLAQALAGGAAQLAERLGVRPDELQRWLAGQDAPPRRVFDQALGLVLDDYDARRKPS
jgi:hypothetical protein